MTNSLKPNPSNPAPQVDISGRRLAHNTALNLVGRVAPLLVAIFTVPYVIHHLGPNRYGLYSLAWIVVGYFALFNLGIGPATTKFVAEFLGKGEMEKLPELVWTAVSSQMCLGLAGGLLLALASPLLVSRVLKIPAELHPQAQVIFLIMAALLPFDFASGSMQGVLGASQRFDLLNAVSIPTSALSYLLPVAALALGFGLPAIVLVLALARIAGLAVVAVLCLRLYPALRRLRFDFRLVRSLLGYGGWVTAAGAVGPLLLYTDRFVIGAVVSIAAVGYYSVAFNALRYLQFVPAALAGPLMPAFSSLHGAGDKSRTTALFLRSHKYIFLAITPGLLAAIVFARNIFDLWIGGEFAAKATLPFQIIAVGMLIALLAPLSGALTQGRGRPDVLFWLYLVELPINTLLTWELASRWGIVGAALSFTLRAFAETALLVFVTARVFSLNFHTITRRRALQMLGLFAFSALAILLGWSIAAEPFMSKALMYSGAMAVYAFVSYRYALDASERSLLWEIVGRRWMSARQVGAP